MFIEGLLVKTLRNSGSKSEHIGFALRKDDNSMIAIYKEGDNPFEHESLKPLEGKRIKATGEFFKSKFCAVQVEII